MHVKGDEFLICVSPKNFPCRPSRLPLRPTNISFKSLSNFPLVPAPAAPDQIPAFKSSKFPAARPQRPTQNLAITVHIIGFFPADHGWSENVVQAKYPYLAICRVPTHPDTQYLRFSRCVPIWHHLHSQNFIKFPAPCRSPASAPRHGSPRLPVCASF